MLGHMTIVDLSMSAYLFYREEYGMDWTKFPQIKACSANQDCFADQDLADADFRARGLEAAI